ncbi:hypothetical protein [Fodinibius salsisoli]|uniref:DUF4153 domain-containing protein n=1 Tax=Fodinibius salsisoli TaxID=2820877 RepID=A0ABT3PMW1_9BACT|nr:hypothetical protein [Fodinibius salsisoli]MCW9707280.1 hypothetical protein [Fodinibius salsisoli]
MDIYHGKPKEQKETIVAFALALAAAILIKTPAFFGIQLDQDESFYIRNMSLFVLPLLTGYFVWKRQLEARTLPVLALAFIAAAIFANIYPFDPGGDTEALFALHLPIALWLIVGVAYSGGRWDQVNARMDYIRFSGELFIYYVLIALGGGVLTGFMALIFGTIGIDIEPFFESWILPCGATGAVIVASWLVETRKSLTENIAPVLARLFTPLFTIILITFLGTLLWTGRGVDIERDVLIAFDMLLLIVLGLLLYCISARDTGSSPGLFDAVLVVLVVSSLLADAVALWAITERITELGFTPNRVAALGMNIILLINLLWSTVLYLRFLSRGGSFQALLRWQTAYLLVYAVWAAIVVIVFPPLFKFG